MPRIQNRQKKQKLHLAIKFVALIHLNKTQKKGKTKII